MWALDKRFSKNIFDKNVNKNIAKKFIFFRKLKNLPNNKFNDYNWQGLKLASYFFSDYLKTITIIKDKNRKMVIYFL